MGQTEGLIRLLNNLPYLTVTAGSSPVLYSSVGITAELLSTFNSVYLVNEKGKSPHCLEITGKEKSNQNSTVI